MWKLELLIVGEMIKYYSTLEDILAKIKLKLESTICSHTSREQHKVVFMKTLVALLLTSEQLEKT